MLVWVASYPRSGNTYLRIALNRLYGVRTSTIYDVDGVARRLGNDLVGYEDRPAGLAAMRAADELYFVKTHRQRDDDIDHADRVICLVRDGRDALVSWARQLSEGPDRDFETELVRLLRLSKPSGTSTWGRTVLSWLRPQAPHRVVLRFEHLIGDVAGELRRTVTELGLALRPVDDAAVPSFAELQTVDPLFFRRGRAGTHRDELPERLHRLFWSDPDNAAAMAALGYGVAPETARVSPPRSLQP